MNTRRQRQAMRSLPISHVELRKILGRQFEDLRYDMLKLPTPPPHAIFRPSTLHTRTWVRGLRDAVYEAKFVDYLAQHRGLSMMKNTLGCLVPVLCLVGVAILSNRYLLGENPDLEEAILVLGMVGSVYLGIALSHRIHRYIRKRLLDRWDSALSHDVEHYMQHVRPTIVGKLLDEIEHYNQSLEELWWYLETSRRLETRTSSLPQPPEETLIRLHHETKAFLLSALARARQPLKHQEQQKTGNMENNAGVGLAIEHATFVTTLGAIRKRVKEIMKEL